MEPTASTRLREHNLVVTVGDEDAADRVVELFADVGVSMDEITVDSDRDRRSALRSAVYAEEDRMMAGPAVPATGSMVKGALIGTVIGAVLGALLLLPVAAIPFSDMDLALRLLVTGLTGAVAGGAAGFTYFGSRVPEEEEEPWTPPAETGIIVAVHTDDPETAIRAEEAASRAGPQRIDWIDRTRAPKAADDDMPYRDRGTTTLR